MLVLACIEAESDGKEEAACGEPDYPVNGQVLAEDSRIILSICIVCSPVISFSFSLLRCSICTLSVLEYL